MIKLLIGGSPCTYWSIAQKNNRETQAEGQGWELFKNYLIAKEKFQPDFFLYENNKSAAQAIKDQIKKELCVENDDNQINLFSVGTGARYIEINSALVSAQNRQRFYVHNCGDVKQPEDRGILLRDILEHNDTSWLDKSRCIDANYYKASDGTVPMQGSQSSDRMMAAEPVKCLTEGEMDYMVRDHQEQRWSFLNRPAQDDKAHTVVANFRKGVPYNVCAEPVNITDSGKSQTIKSQYDKTSIQNICCYTSTYGATGVAMPTEDKPTEQTETDGKDQNAMKNVYEVKDGKIAIKGKLYPIKLADGYYRIRKLTVTECCRLQTMPDDYCKAVSNSRAYAGLGNGWTAEVIIHILNEALKDVPRDEEIEVLSMYDGIGTGRYCLDKMGFTNVKYYAYEIDKYAMQVALDNYPDIIECGDAFQVREDGWKLHD